ncbi:histidine--tRNA ligase [Candidatus Woesearchaeota archaeon]|nr:histidine--tRNA ligase [Candidatus Woesearchaeota archaeon]
MSFQKPKGTEDFYPQDMEIRNRIFDSLRKTSIRYGYKEVSSPAFESISLLSRKEGEEITGQIFSLEKRSNEQLGLKFDLTVPLTRMFMEQQKSITKPVKWFAIDRMWRYEQPQKGRLREFYQLSVELFGADSIVADVEIISLAIDCLTDLGLTENDFYLKLNSRKLLQALLSEFVPENKMEDVIRTIDKKAKISEAAFEEELKKDGVDARKVSELFTKQLDDLGPEADEIKTILKLLGDKKKYVKFDLSTARGLAYYTGIVFEIFDRENKFRSILGGGRYDDLVGLFGGQKAPATGFAVGYATLALLLKEKELLPRSGEGVDYYIAAVSKKEIPEAMKLASRLRDKYAVDIDLMERNLGNQLKYANKIKARKVILVGEEEIKTGKYTVKDLSSGKETKEAF